MMIRSSKNCVKRWHSCSPKFIKRLKLKFSAMTAGFIKLKAGTKAEILCLCRITMLLPPTANGALNHSAQKLKTAKCGAGGTVDTKTPLFAEFSALEELLENGFEPPCNVYIGSSHNEELGGDGIPTALKYFQENNIRFEVILDEGGAVIEPPLGGMKCEKCAMVAVHEKGRYRLNFTAAAGNAHASLTSASVATPLERIVGFISEVNTQNAFIRRLNPQVTAMFSHLAPYCGFPMNVLLSNLWLFGGILKKVMPKINAQAGGLIGTTIAFNKIEGLNENKICTSSALLRSVDESDMKQLKISRRNMI